MGMRTYLTFLAAFAAVSIFAQNSPLEQGRAALLHGDANAAVAALEKAVAQSPNDAVAHYWLGSAYGTKAQQSSMFSAAMIAPKVKEQFEKAVALDPKYIDARMGLVEFYAVAPGFMGGDFDKAVAQAAELRKLDPLQAHRAYAVIYSAQKKPELAKKEYQTANVVISQFTGTSGRDQPFGSQMAAGVVVTIPLVIAVLIFQRRIVAGLTAGGVK